MGMDIAHVHPMKLGRMNGKSGSNEGEKEPLNGASPHYLGESKDKSENLPKTASEAFEVILDHAGNYGIYQWKLTAITGFCGLFTAFHNLGAVFLAAAPDHWCEIPFFAERNLTLDKALLNITAPWVRGKEGTFESSSCKYYDYNYSSVMSQDYGHVNSSSVDLLTLNGLPPTVEKICDSWVYDKGEFKSTVVTEWDLVCERRWLSPFVQSSYMMGLLMGAGVYSLVSDRVGRRPTSLFCCCLFVMASVPIFLVRSLELFLVLRFIVAGAGQGMYLINFTILMETTSLKGRTILGGVFGVFFTIGYTLLGFLSYAIRDWRPLQLTISFPTILLLAYFWLLPESPRWLLFHGKEEEGLQLLRTIAAQNGKKFPATEELKHILTLIRDQEPLTEEASMKESIKSMINIATTLVRTRNMRCRSLVVFYAWFVVGVCAYGLPFSGSNLNISPHAISAASFLASFGSLVIRIGFLLRFGRKTVTSFSFITGGVVLTAIAFVPIDMTAVNLSLVALGHALMKTCFGMMFLLSVELVPTHVRNVSIGMGSVCARIGTILVPFVVELLGDLYYAIPSTIFGLLSITAGFLALLLPETGHSCLPESVEEIEAMPR